MADQLRGESEFKYQVLLARNFQRAIEALKSKQIKAEVFELMVALAMGGSSGVESTKVDGSVVIGKMPSGAKLVYRVLDIPPNKTLYFLDLAAGEELKTILERIASQDEQKERLDRRRAIAFSKIVPDWALRSADGLEEILRLEKADLLLTPEQLKILSGNPPMMIHGRAGSGKTLVLCNNLSRSVHSGFESRARLGFLSYNTRLVERARKDTEEIMQGQYQSENSLEGVNFSTLQEFLKGYVRNPERFNSKTYVGFYKFKQAYVPYSRGFQGIRRISPEKAWHGIRSILKGACMPPYPPPLEKQEYEKLARRRKDFASDEFDLIYRIGQWYQKEMLGAHGLWDDQDLAWEALNSIFADRTLGTKSLYDKIFCDEAQDLTQIEFRALVAVCRPPAYDTDGFQLVMAADPLQTINPTGFRWNVVKDEIFRVQRGRKVEFSELSENFRSDEKIVHFANRVQEIRGHFIGESPEPQEGLLQEGEMPVAVPIEENAGSSVLESKLSELPPESAVIVWPEDESELSSFCETEPPLLRIDKDLDLYTISQAKGLEFRSVVLYKFGSSSDAFRFRKYLAKDMASGQGRLTPDDEIPLLYFLNRLYVAATRAKLYLVLVDTKEGIENLRSIWGDLLEVIPAVEARSHLEGSPAFQGDFSENKWRRWGYTLLEHAEESIDIRAFERARRAFDRAGDQSRVKWVTARIREIEENWKEAGTLYYDLGDFRKAGACFERAELWDQAYQSFERLPVNVEISRRMAICKFRRDLPKSKSKAALEFQEYAKQDTELDRDLLEELADILSSVDANAAADVAEKIGENFKDNSRLISAARFRYNQKDYQSAKRLFELAGDTKSKQYELSLAETVLLDGDFDRAIDLFYRNGANQRVVDCYLATPKNKQLLSHTRGQVAEVYLALGMKETSAEIYADLATEFTGKGQWIGALGCIRPDVFDSETRIDQFCWILGKAADSEKKFSEAEEDALMQAIRVAVAGSYWDLRISPEVMGTLYQRCAGPRETSEFYARHTDEEWARRPYVRALEDLVKVYRGDKNEERAREVERDIRDVREKWGI